MPTWDWRNAFCASPVLAMTMTTRVPPRVIFLPRSTALTPSTSSVGPERAALPTSAGAAWRAAQRVETLAQKMRQRRKLVITGRWTRVGGLERVGDLRGNEEPRVVATGEGL